MNIHRAYHGTRAGRWLVRLAPERLAPREPLTGAGCRCAIPRIRPAAHLALVGVSGIRRVNEAGGMAAGNRLLVELVAGLRALLPKARVYRLGGDEFVVEVAPVTDEAAALRLAHRIATLARPSGDDTLCLRVAVDTAPAGSDLRAAVRRLDDALRRLPDRAGGVAVVGPPA